MITFVIHKDRKGEWRCRFRAQNGKTILLEGYKRRGHVRKMIAKLIMGPHTIVEE